MDEPFALLLCDDLIFVSRIAGTAKAAGLHMRAVKTPAELLQLAQQAPPRCVIADLHTPGLALEQFARDLQALTPKLTLVGYGSHVDIETLKLAGDAGFDVVWPRSKFVEELATALPEWFGER
jgi:DNA-binding NarL/FixJ family response regulator